MELDLISSDSMTSFVLSGCSAKKAKVFSERIFFKMLEKERVSDRYLAL